MKHLSVLLYTIVLAWSGSVGFDTILKEGIQNNIGLKIIQTNAAITEAKIDEINALYYPTLSLDFSTEYTKGLGDGEEDLVVVGDTTMNNQTQYEVSVALRLGYRLYDFGARSIQKEMAILDRTLVDFDLSKSRQELKLKLLELYSQILSNKKQLYYYRKIKKLQKKIYLHMKRLRKAKQIGKAELAAQSITLANLANQMIQIDIALQEAVSQINYHTGKHYSTQSRYRSFSIPKHLRQKYKKSWQYQSWSRKIEKKHKEIELLHSQQYPAIDLYAKYNFYGSAKCQLGCAFENLEPANYVIGVRASITLFEGFKSDATERRLRAELEQLRLQRLQSAREYQQQQRDLAQQARYMGEEIGLYKELIGYQQEKLHIQKRLFKNKEVTAIVKLQDEIALLYKKLELSVKKVAKATKLKEMEIRNAN